MIRRPPRSTLFPTRRSSDLPGALRNQKTVKIGSLLTPYSHYGSLTQRATDGARSEEHTSELQSQSNLVCRLLLEKNNSLPPSTAWTSPVLSPVVFFHGAWSP